MAPDTFVPVTTPLVICWGLNALPSRNNSASNLPGPQLFRTVSTVSSETPRRSATGCRFGAAATIVPTLRSRLAKPSILAPMLGATESSTVEWQIAHVRPTEVSVLLPLLKKPTTPRIAFCLINCSVTAGSSRFTLPCLIASTVEGESALESTFRPSASACRGVSVLIAL